MTWAVIIAAVVGAWAVLRIVGGERERRMRELAVMVEVAQIEAQREAEARRALPAPAGAETGTPVRSKVGR
ncbi:MAG TPA: hypothetical protein VEA69_17120 [Tepidisphaeraceae bacterium]|nr:hypothetical protein [Tepidisphaeraceae bacterium]